MSWRSVALGGWRHEASNKVAWRGLFVVATKGNGSRPSKGVDLRSSGLVTTEAAYAVDLK